MEPNFVVIIQCDIAQRRCSGYACTQAFYNRNELFKAYGAETRYLSFTCGGCCGKGVAAKLEHFSNKLLKKTDLTKDQVAIHLASCMVTDNHHYDRCPHLAYIRQIVAKHGFNQVVEGTYISKASAVNRAAGIYKTY